MFEKCYLINQELQTPLMSEIQAEILQFLDNIGVSVISENEFQLFIISLLIIKKAQLEKQYPTLALDLQCSKYESEKISYYVEHISLYLIQCSQQSKNEKILFSLITTLIDSIHPNFDLTSCNIFIILFSFQNLLQNVQKNKG